MSSTRFLRFARLLALPVASIFIFQSCVDNHETPEPFLPPNSCAPEFQYGYTDKVSYAPHEKVTAFLQARKTVDACRLTIYSINGEEVFSIVSPLWTQQIASDNPSAEGYEFQPTVSFDLPSTITSGVYLIEKQIPFIVKANHPVDLLIVYPSNTANAYCESGGKSLYTALPDRLNQVSFHRPIPLESFSSYCLQWFRQQHQFSIGYIADSDLDDYTEIERAKILIIVGHNEYWTRSARHNFDQFINVGNHALVLSGNTMWWQSRYAGTDKSQLICYRDGDSDPETNLLLKTILWNNPSLNYPIINSIGADFNYGGYGLYTDNGWNGYKIALPTSPLLKNTGLSKGAILSCPTTEYDGAPILSFDAEGYPVLDKALLNFDKVELIAFDKGFRVHETYGTFTVLQRTKTSGIIINTGSTDWCSVNGMGGQSANTIKLITLNAINALLDGENVFSN